MRYHAIATCFGVNPPNKVLFSTLCLLQNVAKGRQTKQKMNLHLFARNSSTNNNKNKSVANFHYVFCSNWKSIRLNRTHLYDTCVQILIQRVELQFHEIFSSKKRNEWMKMKQKHGIVNKRNNKNILFGNKTSSEKEIIEISPANSNINTWS